MLRKTTADRTQDISATVRHTEVEIQDDRAGRDLVGAATDVSDLIAEQVWSLHRTPSGLGPSITLIDPSQRDVMMLAVGGSGGKAASWDPDGLCAVCVRAIRNRL
jgi:hypothetical protein